MNDKLLAITLINGGLCKQL